MTGKRIFFLPLILILMSCAKPQYLASSDFRPGEKATNQFEFGKSMVWLTWEKAPSSGPLESFILKFGRPNLGDGSPLPQDIEGEIEVELWMSSMGHGSTPVTIEKLDIGTYRVGEVFFPMTGKWEIRIRRLINGVIIEQAEVPVRI